MVSLFKKFLLNILNYFGLFERRAKLLILGLDDSGKTTLLGLLKTGKIWCFRPGCKNKEEFKLENIRFTSYDLPENEWRKNFEMYIAKVDGILFLVDCADATLFPRVKEVIKELFEVPELMKVPFAIMGNKIDKSFAVSEDELREELQFEEFCKDKRKVELFMCSVCKRLGYLEPIEWISSFLELY